MQEFKLRHQIQVQDIPHSHKHNLELLEKELLNFQVLSLVRTELPTSPSICFNIVAGARSVHSALISTKCPIFSQLIQSKQAHRGVASQKCELFLFP